MTDSTNQKTRDAHKTLLGVVQEFSDSLDSMSLEDRIEVGSVLWDLGDAMEGLMDRIKESIREKALESLGGGAGTVEFSGSDVGQVAVNVPKPSLKVSQGKKLEELRIALGPDFGLFFEESHTYKVRSEFRGRVKAVTDPLHQKALLDAIETSESKPRVSFRRFPSVRVKSLSDD
jgi:hypothetical protein